MNIFSLTKAITSSLSQNLCLAKSDDERHAYAAAALEDAAGRVFPKLHLIAAEKGEASDEHRQALEAVLETVAAAGIPFVRSCTDYRRAIDFLEELAEKSSHPQVKKKLVVYANQLKKSWNDAEPGGIHHGPRAKRSRSGDTSNWGSALLLAGSLLAIGFFVFSSDLATSVFPRWNEQPAQKAENKSPQAAVEAREQAEAPPPEPTVTSSKTGDFCRYTDDSGTIHLANDPAKVPDKYRSRMEIVASGGDVTPVTCSGDRVLVPVTLRYRGREVQTVLLLDTGATLTTINESVASRLGIDRRDMRSAISTVADGRAVSTFNFAAESVTVGTRSLPGRIVSILQGSGGNGAEGLLGMNFLKEFRYHIDFRRGVIEWGS